LYVVKRPFVIIIIIVVVAVVGIIIIKIEYKNTSISVVPLYLLIRIFRFIK